VPFVLKKYLLAPGPTPVPPEVLLAMARPMIHHRASEFSDLLGRVKQDLQWLFQTRGDVLILASTGTGGMEGAVSNFLSPGEKALVVNGGKFGERWVKICKAYGIKIEELKVEWGQAVDPEEIRRALTKDSSFKAVYIQASESSTGVAHHTQEIAAVVRSFPETLMVVDAISALGALDLKVDDWGLDVVVAASQKAFMLPPGLAFVSVSERAWRKAQGTNNSKFYFDFKKERDGLVKNQTAYTPAVSLVIGLAEVLKLLKEEGLQNIFQRHRLLSQATREAMKAIGLSLFAKNSPSVSITAVLAPEGYDGQTIYKNLREHYGVTAAGGQDHAKGKIFRIAHMGYAQTFDVIIAVSAVEMVLRGMGYPVKLGTGVGVAEEILLKK
jgi:aspartate aminotransferase-like enzyme